MRNSAGTWVFLLELKRGASSCAEALTCADDKRAFSGLASGISGRAPASAFSFQRRHSGGRFRPQLRVVASSSSARRARGRRGRRLQRFAEQVEQTRPGPLRVATVVAEDQADDESLVVVSRCIVRRGAAFGPVRFVEPAGGLVATLLELARQPLADLPRTRLDLAPVAGLNQQPFGKAAVEPAQGRVVGMLDRGADEIVSMGFNRDVVMKVLRMIDINEYKRRQAAPGLKVTAKAFGTGRRMPIAQKFREAANPKS